MPGFTARPVGTRLEGVGTRPAEAPGAPGPCPTTAHPLARPQTPSEGAAATGGGGTAVGIGTGGGTETGTEIGTGIGTGIPETAECPVGTGIIGTGLVP